MALSVILVSGLFIGFAKTGITTMGMMVVIVMTLAFPVRESVGIVLPILIVGDLFAVIYYRRSVIWKHLFSLVPWVLTGIVAGYLVLRYMEGNQLSLLMGTLILSLVILQGIRDVLKPKWMENVPKSLAFTVFMGVLAGFATTIGNVSGVVMAMYLMSKQLPKQEFVGTGAWFFLFVNVIKIPFYVSLGMIDIASLSLNVWMVPAVFAGALLGVKVLRLIPQRAFQLLVLFLGATGAVRLIVMDL